MFKKGEKYQDFASRIYFSSKFPFSSRHPLYIATPDFRELQFDLKIHQNSEINFLSLIRISVTNEENHLIFLVRSVATTNLIDVMLSTQMAYLKQRLDSGIDFDFFLGRF